MNKNNIQKLLLTPIMWGLYLLSFLFKRDEDKIAFGCHTKLPTGNIFAFFKDVLICSKDANNVCWIAKNNEEYSYLQANNFPVIKKYSMRGIKYCLTAKYYCYSQYVNDVSFSLSARTVKVNLWHGTPMKKIERDISTGKYALRYKYKMIFKIIQPWVFCKPHNFFVSSGYEKRIFKKAFNINESQMYLSFPPRLKELREKIGHVAMRKYNNSFRSKKVLICPTFRDIGEYDYSKLINFEKLNGFGATENLQFLIKLHPADKSTLPLNDAYKHVSVIDSSINIYELLGAVDLVVTDYSSIFFDALALNIPFFFYFPDVNEYMKTSREFYFDASECFPKLVAYTQDELENLLLNVSSVEEEVPTEFVYFQVSQNYPLDVFK